jgi:hypothetical protein
MSSEGDGLIARRPCQGHDVVQAAALSIDSFAIRGRRMCADVMCGCCSCCLTIADPAAGQSVCAEATCDLRRTTHLTTLRRAPLSQREGTAWHRRCRRGRAPQAELRSTPPNMLIEGGSSAPDYAVTAAYGGPEERRLAEGLGRQSPHARAAVEQPSGRLGEATMGAVEWREAAGVRRGACRSLRR